jgi:hypothetical protein
MILENVKLKWISFSKSLWFYVSSPTFYWLKYVFYVHNSDICKDILVVDLAVKKIKKQYLKLVRVSIETSLYNCRFFNCFDHVYLNNFD